MNFVSRLLSLIDYRRARKHYDCGELIEGRILAKQAAYRKGATLLPLLFEYDLLMKEGDIPGGLELRKRIKGVLDLRAGFNPETRNYIDYYMLQAAPATYFEGLSSVDATDPKLMDISKVRSVYRNQLPYKPPRKHLVELLQNY